METNLDQLKTNLASPISFQNKIKFVLTFKKPCSIPAAQKYKKTHARMTFFKVADGEYSPKYCHDGTINFWAI